MKGPKLGLTVFLVLVFATYQLEHFCMDRADFKLYFEVDQQEELTRAILDIDWIPIQKLQTKVIEADPPLTSDLVFDIELYKEVGKEELYKQDKLIDALIDQYQRKHKILARVFVRYRFGDKRLIPHTGRFGTEIYSDEILDNIENEIESLSTYPIQEVWVQVDKYLRPYMFMMIHLKEALGNEKLRELHDTIDDIVFKHCDKEDYDPDSWHTGYYYDDKNILGGMRGRSRGKSKTSK